MTLDVPDRLAVSDLVHLYASAVDDRRFDDVVELFTDTAELRLPDPPRSLDPTVHRHGRDGVRAAMAALARVSRTEHAIVGEVYARADDRDYALGRITCVAHHWSVDPDGAGSDVVASALRRRVSAHPPRMAVPWPRPDDQCDRDPSGATRPTASRR